MSLIAHGGPAFDVQGEFKLTFPTGGMKYLVPSPDYKVCAATWLEQVNWGYELFDLPSRQQLVG